VILRFHGSQYRKDKTFSKGDKAAIRDVLSAFCSMGQGYDPKCRL
jgi:hypothetical protein